MIRRRFLLPTGLLVLSLTAAACGGGAADVETGAGAVGESASGGQSVPPGTEGADVVVPEGPTWPLTHLPAEGDDPIDRAAVVVKIDNDPNARPQSGLNQADVVYEIEVEGITRFAAVFQSADVDPVGPIRSARSSDIDVIGALHAPVFAWSGANATVTAEVTGAQTRGLLVDQSHNVAQDRYWRDTSRYAPHNLFSTTAGLREVATGTGVPTPIWSYRADGERLPQEAIPVAGVAVAYVGDGRITNVEFAWDPDLEGWARFQTDRLHGDGSLAHLDAAGEQVAPENVVILSTTYSTSAAGGGSPQALSVDEGDAIVLTAGGQAIEGRWMRGSATDPVRIQTPDGGVIKLSPGRTWVLMPQAGHTTYLTPDRGQQLLTAN